MSAFLAKYRVQVTIAALAALLLGYAVWSRSSGEKAPSAPSPAGEAAATSTPTAAATTTPVSPAPAAKKPAATAPSPSGYSQALDKYGKSGYRIQFTNCSATPSKLAVAKTASFMLDNRDAVAHTVKIGSYTYRLGAQGYAIASITKVGTYNMTCDGGGTGQLVVQ